MESPKHIKISDLMGDKCPICGSVRTSKVLKTRIPEAMNTNDVSIISRRRKCESCKESSNLWTTTEVNKDELERLISRFNKYRILIHKAMLVENN